MKEPESPSKPVGEPADERSARALVAEALMGAVSGARTDREVVYGAVFALGRVGNAGEGALDARIRKALMKVGEDGDTHRQGEGKSFDETSSKPEQSCTGNQGGDVAIENTGKGAEKP